MSEQDLPRRPRGRPRKDDTTVYAPPKRTRTKRLKKALPTVDPLTGLPFRPRGRPRSNDTTVYAPNANKKRLLLSVAPTGGIPENLTGKVFGHWKPLYRGTPQKPSIPGRQIPWKCECINCGNEQWILPIMFKWDRNRARCAQCQYAKTCIGCGEPIKDGRLRRRTCSEQCRHKIRLIRASHHSRRSAIALQIARSHGFEPNHDEAPAWRQWAESMGIDLDAMAREIANDADA